jgi:hypothetical protein
MKTVTISSNALNPIETTAQREETVTFALSGIPIAHIVFSNGSPFTSSDFWVDNVETSAAVRGDAAIATYPFTADTDPDGHPDREESEVINGSIKVGSNY